MKYEIESDERAKNKVLMKHDMTTANLKILNR
jgi:hypothetical protein